MRGVPPLAVPFDDGMLIVSPDDRLLAYNATASFIWRLLAAGGSRADVISALVTGFGIASERASAELDAIIEHWRREGLLGGAGGASAAATPDVPVVTAAPVGWAAAWQCEFGTRVVEFATEGPESTSIVRSTLRPLEVTEKSPETRIEIRVVDGGRWVVIRDRELIRGPVPRDGLKEAFYEALVGFLWPGRAVDALIHAGAVGRDGRAICFPAFSGRGKSTLVAHLVGIGYQYLADDVTMLDCAGEVLPLPIPMSVKEGSWHLLEGVLPALRSAPIVNVKQTRARLVSSPGASNARPTPLAALVFPRYSRESAAALHLIRPLEALTRLREAGAWFGHPLTHDRVVRLARWLERTSAYTLEYADLSDATRLLAELERGVGRQSPFGPAGTGS